LDAPFGPFQDETILKLTPGTYTLYVRQKNSCGAALTLQF
jgi:hypothetical protein